MDVAGIALIIIACLIILGLGAYAGKLLFLLQAQNQKQQQVRNERIENIQQSIQTIAFAMLQQQCDLSEGVIRICRLLEALPLTPRPDYSVMFPSVFNLFEKVKDYPTHEKRAAQSKFTRRKQDKERQEFESELENKILEEAELLRKFDARQDLKTG